MLSAKKRYAHWEKTVHAAINGLLQSAPVKKFAANYPRSYKLVIGRFSLDAFTGLPFTFLLLAFFTNAFLLSNIISALVNSTGIVLLDTSFAQLMFSLRLKGLIDVFYWFSRLGSFAGVVAVLAVSSAVLWVRGKRIFILPLLVSTIGSDLVMATAKKYFHRVRPEAFWYYHEHDFSFPSGHATISVAFYGVLFYSVIRTRRKYASKFRWLIAAFAFIGLLGFSRLYLCVHYLSDVIAGYLLGCLWLIVAVSMSEWVLHRRKKIKNDAMSRDAER
jgi:undecaprenyl-diphosphatase